MKDISVRVNGRNKFPNGFRFRGEEFHCTSGYVCGVVLHVVMPNFINHFPHRHPVVVPNLSYTVDVR